MSETICELETTEDGVDLEQLAIGAVLDVETAHSLYRIENRGDGDVLISGNADFCPVPVKVKLHGSSLGIAMLRAGFIGRRMKMEFRHPERGIVRTSPVLEIRELQIRERDANN